MTFDEEPNYDKLKFMLEINLLNLNIVPTHRICFVEEEKECE